MLDTTTRLSGIIPPMITPLTESGQIDVPGLERLVNHMLRGGVSGIFVLGSSGEGPWLTRDQQRQMVQETVRLVGGKVPVLAGALEAGTARTLEVLYQHQDAGADMIVIASPYYYGAGPAVQIEHVTTLVNAASVPVILYNIPPMTHNPISPATVQQVLGLENLVGVKDSAGNWDDFQDLLRLKTERPDFAVFQGAERLAAQSLLAGADGIVPGLGNVVPEIFQQIHAAALDGRPADAEHLQEKIERLWVLHTYDYWLVCLKYAASVLGFGSGRTCGHPNTIAPADRELIRELINEAAQVQHQ